MHRTNAFAVAALLAVGGCATAGTTTDVAAPGAGGGAREEPRRITPGRPIPGPVIPSVDFARAVERGTRTRTGEPGPRYWQQWAEYRIDAELEPNTKLLSGRSTVRYFNRSPDTLRTIAVHLLQNVYRPDALRNVAAAVTDGITLLRVRADGQLLPRVPTADSLAVSHWVDGTIARLRLPSPLLPGGTAELGFEWRFTAPGEEGIREGTDGEVFHNAYWYPQIAVYDDVVGWQTDPYMGGAEFYMGYGDYDVRLTVPQGWLIGATGTLVNAPEVLSRSTRARIAEAARSGRVVHVVGDDGRMPGTSTVRSTTGKLTWRFQAKNVRDFAWATSSQYLWDATLAVSGDANRDGRADSALVHALYRPSRRAWAWDSAAHYGRHSVEFLSELLWPYGYPQMTIIDGIDACGGMEYPMITCIGGERDTLSLYGVIVHEIGHMWFPMQVGSDEKRYAWQDEGLTRYNQSLAMNAYFRGYDRFQLSRDNYYRIVRDGDELELMRHGDMYPRTTSAYSRASYDKMSLTLAMLRSLLGDDVFLRAYREYARRWLNKHPAPYDLWNTFESVSGRDLDWFWQTWWFETWTLDHAIAGVRTSGDSVEIEIEDRGLAFMPVRLAITRQSGRVERLEVPVEIWLGGARRHVARVAATPTIERVEIDPERAFLDVYRSNQLWARDSVSASPTRDAPRAQ